MSKTTLTEEDLELLSEALDKMPDESKGANFLLSLMGKDLKGDSKVRFEREMEKMKREDQVKAADRKISIDILGGKLATMRLDIREDEAIRNSNLEDSIKEELTR